MFGLPTTDLWGVGSKTAGKLAELGIRTVGDLATADEDALAERFGLNTGPWLASLGRGRARRGCTRRAGRRRVTDASARSSATSPIDEIRRETVRLADAVSTTSGARSDRRRTSRRRSVSRRSSPAPTG